MSSTIYLEGGLHWRPAKQNPLFMRVCAASPLQNTLFLGIFEGGW